MSLRVPLARSGDRFPDNSLVRTLRGLGWVHHGAHQEWVVDGRGSVRCAREQSPPRTGRRLRSSRPTPRSRVAAGAPRVCRRPAGVSSRGGCGSPVDGGPRGRSRCRERCPAPGQRSRSLAMSAGAPPPLPTPWSTGPYRAAPAPRRGHRRSGWRRRSRAIGGDSFSGEYLAVHTENHADGPLTLGAAALLPKPTTPGGRLPGRRRK